MTQDIVAGPVLLQTAARAAKELSRGRYDLVTGYYRGPGGTYRLDGPGGATVVYRVPEDEADLFTARLFRARASRYDLEFRGAAVEARDAADNDEHERAAELREDAEIARRKRDDYRAKASELEAKHARGAA